MAAAAAEARDGQSNDEAPDLFDLPQFGEWKKSQVDDKAVATEPNAGDAEKAKLTEHKKKSQIKGVGTKKKKATSPRQDPSEREEAKADWEVEAERIRAENSTKPNPFADGGDFANDDDTTYISTAQSTAYSTSYSTNIPPENPREILREMNDSFWSCDAERMADVMTYNNMLDVIDYLATGQGCHPADFMNEKGCYGEYVSKKGCVVEYEGTNESPKTKNTISVNKSSSSKAKHGIKRKIFQKSSSRQKVANSASKGMEQQQQAVQELNDLMYQGRSKML